MNKWDIRFMQMAQVIAGWTSCYVAERSIGCVIVKDKRIMTTGYNGAPAGLTTCKERGECMRRNLNIESGTRAEMCYAIHAEQNAIIQAAKLGISIDGATLYCTHQPCSVCAKMIANAGIRRVVYREGYPDAFALTIFREAGVQLEQYACEAQEKRLPRRGAHSMICLTGTTACLCNTCRRDGKVTDGQQCCEAQNKDCAMGGVRSCPLYVPDEEK